MPVQVCFPTREKGTPEAPCSGLAIYSHVGMFLLRVCGFLTWPSGVPGKTQCRVSLCCRRKRARLECNLTQEGRIFPNPGRKSLLHVASKSFTKWYRLKSQQLIKMHRFLVTPKCSEKNTFKPYQKTSSGDSLEGKEYGHVNTGVSANNCPQSDSQIGTPEMWTQAEMYRT